MAKKFLNTIKKRYYKDSANAMAKDNNLSAVRLGNYLRGRPVKDFIIAKFIKKFSKKYHSNGISDSEILNLLVVDYSKDDIEYLINKY